MDCPGKRWIQSEARVAAGFAVLAFRWYSCSACCHSVASRCRHGGAFWPVGGGACPWCDCATAAYLGIRVALTVDRVHPELAMAGIGLVPGDVVEARNRSVLVSRSSGNPIPSGETLDTRRPLLLRYWSS